MGKHTDKVTPKRIKSTETPKDPVLPNTKPLTPEQREERAKNITELAARVFDCNETWFLPYGSSRTADVVSLDHTQARTHRPGYEYALKRDILRRGDTFIIITSNPEDARTLKKAGIKPVTDEWHPDQYPEYVVDMNVPGVYEAFCKILLERSLKATITGATADVAAIQKNAAAKLTGLQREFTKLGIGGGKVLIQEARTGLQSALAATIAGGQAR
jgi:hypothetical protein